MEATLPSPSALSIRRLTLYTLLALQGKVKILSYQSIFIKNTMFKQIILLTMKHVYFHQVSTIPPRGVARAVCCTALSAGAAASTTS